jgi:type IV pilus assembly protein PilN
MYSLDINFLKDRSPAELSENKPVKKQISLDEFKPALLGIGVGALFPVLAFGVLWWLQGQNQGLETAIAQLEQENTKLDGQIADLNKIKGETAGVKEQTQALVSVFDQIRPWSAMLKDLRDRIPANVQIETIKQIPPVIQPANATGPKPSNPAGLLEISGYARSFSDVNDFLLSIGQSKLLNAADSRISTAELIDAPPITGAVTLETKSQGNQPDVKIKPLQVVKYTIKASLSSVPASELISELEQKGTVGLVERIRSLQKTGALSNDPK